MLIPFKPITELIFIKDIYLEKNKIYIKIQFKQFPKSKSTLD